MTRRPLILGILLAVGTLPGAASSRSGDGPRRPEETIEAAPPASVIVSFRARSGGFWNRRGRSPERISPGELTVLEGGRALDVLAVEPLAGDGLEAWSDDPPGPALEVPWRLVIWFDRDLVSPRSLLRVAGALAEESATLTALGSVEVVLAGSGEPEVRLGATRDPKLVARALRGLAMAGPAAGSLLGQRERLRRELGGPIGAAVQASGDDLVHDRVVAVARAEQEVVHGRLQGLLKWLTESRRSVGYEPRAVLWVSDGFDLSPEGLYARAVPEGPLRDRFRDELARFGLRGSVEDFAEAAARIGWTVVPVAFGLRPFGLSSGEQLFADPLAPLEAAAEATGAQVVRKGEVRRTLARLGSRWRLDVGRPSGPGADVPEAAAGGGELGRDRLEVLSRRRDLEVLAPAVLPRVPATGEGATGRPYVLPVPEGLGIGTADLPAILEPATGGDGVEAIHLLPTAEAVVTGRTRIAVQALRPEVAAVEFRVGGERVGTDRKPPFEIRADLPQIPRTSTVVAVALDAAGAEIGRDTMELNRFPGELAVRFLEPRTIPGPGRYTVEVEVWRPTGGGIATVDLSWNGRHLERLRHPPYRTTVVVPPGAESGFLRAVASLPGGGTSEAVLAQGRQGFVEEVEVDLVQLPAVVWDRRDRPVAGLGPDDFLVREEGREQRLRTVEPAASVPLNVALTVDVSTSIEGALPEVKAAAVQFLRQVLGPQDRAMLVAFAARPTLVAPVTGDLDALQRAVESLAVGPNTALYDALMLSLFHLREVSGRRAVVLLTDGRDTVSKHGGSQAREFARRTGVPVYVVYFGPGGLQSASVLTRESEFRHVARGTGGRFHRAVDARRLASAYAEIAEELRHQYLLTYASDREPGGSGWRAVEVEVLRPGLRARTVAGYFQEP